MSMSFFNESFYDGTGSIADAMDVLSAGGTLMVASAETTRANTTAGT